jgi:hypothetical protein
MLARAPNTHQSAIYINSPLRGGKFGRDGAFIIADATCFHINSPLPRGSVLGPSANAVILR